MSDLQHVAIIMDGNGRWARKRKMPRIFGHSQGIKTAERIMEACAKTPLKILTLFTFSTENWKRSKKEVNQLMKKLEDNLKCNWEKLNKNNIRFNVIGRLSELPESLRKEIEKVKKATSRNTGMLVNLALNYGGRQEIVDAIKRLGKQIKEKNFDPERLDENVFSEFLYTKDFADPDLIIRTSGEKRISNFLLWQSAYSELYFTDVLWPDFTEEELEKAFSDYSKRKRRFGE